MDVSSAIRNRRSIRKFKRNPVSDENIKIILEAAMHCPSACNMRPYEFAVVRNKQKIAELQRVCPRWKMLDDAPAVIVVCARPDLEKAIGHEFWQQDCSAATQNILLQALDLGLGSCWCGVYPVEERVNGIRTALNLKNNCVPFSLIALGEPNEQPQEKDFYDEKLVKFYD